jgi:hypothetical protein
VAIRRSSPREAIHRSNQVACRPSSLAAIRRSSRVVTHRSSRVVTHLNSPLIHRRVAILRKHLRVDIRLSSQERMGLRVQSPLALRLRHARRAR